MPPKSVLTQAPNFGLWAHLQKVQQPVGQLPPWPGPGRSQAWASDWREKTPSCWNLWLMVRAFELLLHTHAERPIRKVTTQTPRPSVGLVLPQPTHLADRRQLACFLH